MKAAEATPALATLDKILLLEERHGFKDRAVVGGLEAFLAHWRERSGLPPRSQEAFRLCLDGYGRAGAAERAAAVRAARALIQGEGPGPAPPATDGARPLPLPPVRLPAREAAARLGPPTGLEDGGPALRKADHPTLRDPVGGLKGVGPRTAQLLARLGVHTVADLLWHVPARYQDFSRAARIADLRPGDMATVAGLVRRRDERRTRAGLKLTTLTVDDGTGTLQVTFFNQPHIAREISAGDALVLSGKVDDFQGRPTMANPEWEALEAESLHTGRLVPIYPLTEGLRQRWMRRMAAEAAASRAADVGEPLPPDLRRRMGLPSRPWALHELHFPADDAGLGRARERLAFDELLLLQLWTRRRRRAARTRPAPDLSAGRPAMDALAAALPFALTGAQRRCLDEVAADLAHPWPMSRLLQGDVGSGKTAVAAGAAAMAIAAGHQAAIMAPTEILADQHYRGLCRLLAPLGYRPYDPGETPMEAASRGEGGHAIARLVGSLPAAAKRKVAAAIAAGEVDLVVGTHAVIQDRVSFPRLGLAVVDEQHRFGVLQRAELQLKRGGASADDGGAPAAPTAHLLVMTATPIPRTLALALNADLDQSVIDEMPAGRQPIKTYWLKPAERDRAYAFIRRRVEAGEQAYVVCPLVEDSEQIQARAATAEFERLQRDVFPDLRLGLLHGRMRAAEKEAAMGRFAGRELDVLVSTAVIEVGVDVPNATVMLIEGADRFGLAQLHQFRGRVGRGDAASACLLVTDNPSRGAAARLQKMTELDPETGLPLSGLALAAFDLEQRGPGDYFGLQQSGVVDRFKFARLAPSRALDLASAAAEGILEADPELARAENAPLAELLAEFTAAAERS